jgi:hypothetical protein
LGNNSSESDITIFVKNYSEHYLEYWDRGAVGGVLEVGVKSVAVTVDPDMILLVWFLKE